MQIHYRFLRYILLLLLGVSANALRAQTPITIGVQLSYARPAQAISCYGVPGIAYNFEGFVYYDGSYGSPYGLYGGTLYSSINCGGVFPSGTVTINLSSPSFRGGECYVAFTIFTADETSATLNCAAGSNQSLFIVNSGGTVTTTFDNGLAEQTSVAGGGIGAAVDASGSFWSVYANGAGVSKFNDAGVLSASHTASNLTSGTGLAIDGNSTVWIAQGGSQNNIFALSNTGAVLSATGFAQAANLGTPASITVDAAGSLWIANQTSNTVTEVVGVAAPVTAPAVQQVIKQDAGTEP